MAYKYGNRNQMSLFPASIEEYVKEDSPVRAYDAIIEALDFKKLGIKLDEKRVGNSSYDPKAMLKLLAYGYSYGIKSSRKLERACHDNLSFIWLVGGLKPDHKTISEFRRKNKKAVTKTLKQVVRICIKLDLIDGNILFVDGSKFRGNAGRNATHTRDWCQKELEKLDERIDQLLIECENQDQAESDETSYVQMNKKLSQAAKLKETIKHALSEMDRKGLEKVNITDPDCGIMKGRQGSHSSYNVQSVVDEKEGLITHIEAVTDKNDLNQFSNQIEKAMKNTQRKCLIACGDAGYNNTGELEKIDSKQISVVVPSRNQSSRKEPNPFHKSQFRYDKKEDCYYCPEGKRLRFGGQFKARSANYYKIERTEICFNCRHYGICTNSREGRRIQRPWNETSAKKFEKQYLDKLEVYKLRQQKVELPFGYMKHNLGYGQFVLRGLEKVQAELSLLASCFNISRMIRIFGVKNLIANIKTYA